MFSNKRKEKNIFKRMWIKCKESKNNYRALAVWLVFAFVLVCAIELVTRANFYSTWKFISSDVKLYLYNVILMLGITLPVFFIKRSGVYYTLIATITLLMALGNKIILGVRGTPLTFSDFYLISEGLSIANKYISPMLFIIVIVILICLIGLMIYLGIKGKNNKRFKGLTTTFIAIVIVVLGIISISTSFRRGNISIYLWDLTQSYKENGLVLSFANSYKAYERKKPIEYTKKNMEALNIKNTNEVSQDAITPNIIMIQLEAFIDPLDIKGVELNEDPIPNFRKYSKMYSSGKVKVSTFGGGTARSDFESQTGMSMEYFSPGEIPYNTVLKNKPIDSLAYILKPYGYKSFAIHNYTGNFYGRNSGLANLGFDYYISREYMTNLEKSETGWPRDSVLIENIKNIILKSDEKDYIYGITVQTHGPYGGKNIPNKGIKVVNDISDTDRDEIECYVNELKEVDLFIKGLIDMVTEIDEPTMVIFYGDHGPALSILNEEESIEDKYETPYFIYNNMELPKQDENLPLYQLSTKVLDSLKIPGGIMPQVHRKYKNNEYYGEVLKLVQYDLLFGKGYIADLNNIYSKTSIIMGLEPVTIKDVTVEDTKNNTKKVYIKGDNFTEYSQVFFDNDSYKPELVNKNLLICEVPDKQDIKDITVKQMGQYNAALSSTPVYNLEK